MHTTTTDVQPQPLARGLRPLSAADTATSTKLTLALGHILAAAIIIPPVTRRLTRR